MLSLPLVRTLESRLAAGQSWTGRHWNSWRKMPHIQRQRRSHNETVGSQSYSVWLCDHNHSKIESHTAGWVTHRLENTYTTEVHPLEWRFWAPSQASQPGGPAMGWEIPRESDFEGSGIWLQDSDRTGGNRLHTWRHTQSSVQVSCRGMGWLWLTMGTRTLEAEVLGSTPWREPSQSLSLVPPKSPDRLQCWVASSQTTNKEGSQSQPSAVNWIKVLRSSAHQSNSQLYPPPVPPIRKLAQAF